jgi:PhzF family phenazine biosynthesis protein
MAVRIFTVDAFAAAAFEGNPAAVVLVEEDKVLSEDQMKKLAAEMNLSETAFVQELPGRWVLL